MSLFSPVLERFAQQAPFCVMARGLLEGVFDPDTIDALFDGHASAQYTGRLLFSTAVDLLTDVVCSVRPSVHAAYRQARQDGRIGVAVKSLYDKLAHTEMGTCRALVRHSAAAVRSVLAHFAHPPAPLLPGYDVRILDGNHLAGTHKRLGRLRREPRAALPGVAVALLDPQARLIADVVLSPDGHAQECALVGPLLDDVRPGQVWIGDRQFCTSAILFGLARRRAFFLIRQHPGHLRWELVGARRYCGRTETGAVYEQPVRLTDPQTGAALTARRVTVELDRPTRDGDTEVHLLSNVPERDADALALAGLYLKRWLVETAFFDLTVHLGCELNTLGYPPAALLGFCLAVCSYNVLAGMKGAVRSVHGPAAEEALSTYYVQDEVRMTYRGLDVATGEQDWAVFRGRTGAALAGLLEELARRADPGYYAKNPVRPKKAKQPRGGCGGDKHVSTHRLLHPELYPQPRKKKKTE
jgi:Transposase DDE domain